MILATNMGDAGLIALVSIGLVFTVLVLLIFVLKLFGVIFKERKATVSAPAAVSSDGITDEEVAAIAVAVNLFFNRHDEESDVTHLPCRNVVVLAEGEDIALLIVTIEEEVDSHCNGCHLLVSNTVR